MSKVFDILAKEQNRQENTVELIASENFVSENVLRALGSEFTNKYTEGYPPQRYENRGRKGRYYGGCQYYDELEEYCCAKWREVFNTDYHVNVQPHSGSQANMAAYAAFLEPGDTILSMSLDAGGHLTHSSPVSFVSHTYKVETYGVNSNGQLNYFELQQKILDYRPKMIVIGASAYPLELSFGTIADVIDESINECHKIDWTTTYDPFIMVDMAHIAGLVATKNHSSPFGWADVITTTTHKTLRGPRGGLIFCKPQYAEKVDKAVFPYTQGGSLMNVIAAKAVCAEEALEPEFTYYINNVVLNCAAMANEFKKLGYNLVGGKTENHLLLLDLRGTEVNGKELQEACDENGITLNKNSIPNDPLPPSEASGVRIGTAAMTTKGWSAEDFINCVHRIDKIIKELKLKNTGVTDSGEIVNVSIFGKYPLETAGFRDIEIWKNATVIVTENLSTHKLELRWMKQPNSEEVNSYPVEDV